MAAAGRAATRAVVVSIRMEAETPNEVGRLSTGAEEELRPTMDRVVLAEAAAQGMTRGVQGEGTQEVVVAATMVTVAEAARSMRETIRTIRRARTMALVM